MTRFASAALFALVLGVAPAFAQAPAPAAPAAPAPAQAAPAAPQAAPTPPPQPPAPFPQGAKIAFVDFQRVAAESAEGQNSTSRINALVTKKQAEGAEKSKALQANQQKLAQSGAVMSDAARTALEKEIERQTREGERFQQDAQAEINELQQELQLEFQKKILPLVQQIREEKGLHVLFSRADAGIVSWDPGIDLTTDLIKKLDAITPKTAAPAAAPRTTAPAAPRPAAPAPAPRPAAPPTPRP